MWGMSDEKDGRADGKGVDAGRFLCIEPDEDEGRHEEKPRPDAEKPAEDGNGHGQHQSEVEVLLARPFLHGPEEPVGHVDDRGQVDDPDVALRDESYELGAEGGRDRRDESENDGLSPVHETAPGEAEDGEEGRDPIEQKA